MSKSIQFDTIKTSLHPLMGALLLLMSFLFAPHASAMTTKEALPYMLTNTTLVLQTISERIGEDGSEQLLAAATESDSQIAALLELLAELTEMYEVLLAEKTEGENPSLVTVSSDDTPLVLIAPNGGESYVSGESTVLIRYNSTGMVGEKLTAYLSYSGSTDVQNVSGEASNSGTISLKLNEGLRTGFYKIKLCADEVHDDLGQDICDMSQNYFTILSAGLASNHSASSSDSEDETTPSGMLSRDYVGTEDIPCPWGETRIGPCKYQGKLMSEGYPPPDANDFREMNVGDVPYYGQTNHRPLYLGGGKKYALKFKGDPALSSFPVVFGAGTIGALMVPLEMFVGISRTKGDFYDVAPGCLVTPASVVNASAGGVEHGAASIQVAWKGGPYDQPAYTKNGTLCLLEPNGYYYVNVAGTCSEYWDKDHSYPGWQNDCPTVLTNANGWMTYLNP